MTALYVRMYIFEYDGTFGCSVIAKRREDGLVTLLQTVVRATFLQAEGILRENRQSPSSRRPQSPREDYLDYYFQI